MAKTTEPTLPSQDDMVKIITKALYQFVSEYPPGTCPTPSEVFTVAFLRGAVFGATTATEYIGSSVKSDLSAMTQQLNQKPN